MYYKFTQDFTQALVTMELNESAMIGYEQTCTLLRELGLLTDSVLLNPLLIDLWNTLSRGSDTTVKVYNVKVIAAAILNFNYPWMKRQSE